MKNKGQHMQLLGIIILAIVVSGLVIAGFTGNLDMSFLKNVGGEDTGEECAGGETQSFNIKSHDKETSAALTEAENAYRKIGEIAWTSFTQGTAITALETGDDYEFVMGIDAAVEAAFAYGPYFQVKNLPCRKTVDMEVYNDEEAGSLTATFYNDDNNAAAMTTVNTQGKAAWATLKWSSGSKEVFGSPYMDSYVTAINDDSRHRPKYPNALCMNLNSTTAEAPEVKYDGVSMNRISTPVLHSGTAGHTSYCFEAPVITDEDALIKVRFEADGSAGGMDVDKTAYLYAGGPYIHSETGEIHWGCATDDGNYVGAAAADSLTLDFS